MIHTYIHTQRYGFHVRDAVLTPRFPRREKEKSGICRRPPNNDAAPSQRVTRPRSPHAGSEIGSDSRPSLPDSEDAVRLSPTKPCIECAHLNTIGRGK